jgi:hypothetical protein
MPTEWALPAAARAEGDADMPSQEMQNSIDALRNRRRASVYQLLLGTPEAAEATERIGKFLRAPVR